MLRNFTPATYHLFYGPDNRHLPAGPDAPLHLRRLPDLAADGLGRTDSRPGAADEPSPKRRHQDISRNVSTPIAHYLRGKPCRTYVAPFDVRLVRSTPNGDASIETVVLPDICVICDPQKLDDRGCLGAPDWIIEILLPGNVSRDTKEKFDLYEEAGVREYWMVTPEQRNVVIYLLGEDGRYQLRGEFYTPGLIPVATLPELQMEWTEVFEGV
ncbi:Uma2 family endonuclease [Hymenobacter sp. BT18]|uniref:Uma2 family endonuclease n=1 Tax=Hymenobacter sp. BT18 TaxID=2835648 RepID=UPI001E404376|nr:Uma2 family endonuclease [Hymenobacter sp. BT18]